MTGTVRQNAMGILSRHLQNREIGSAARKIVREAHYGSTKKAIKLVDRFAQAHGINAEYRQGLRGSKTTLLHHLVRWDMRRPEIHPVVEAIVRKGGFVGKHVVEEAERHSSTRTRKFLRERHGEAASFDEVLKQLRS